MRIFDGILEPIDQSKIKGLSLLPGTDIAIGFDHDQKIDPMKAPLFLLDAINEDGAVESGDIEHPVINREMLLGVEIAFPSDMVMENPDIMYMTIVTHALSSVHLAAFGTNRVIAILTFRRNPALKYGAILKKTKRSEFNEWSEFFKIDKPGNPNLDSVSDKEAVERVKQEIG